MIVGTLCTMVGLLQLAFGPLILPILRPRPNESKLRSYVSGAILVAAAFEAYIALKSYLHSQGYLVVDGSWGSD